jgi:DNA-binding XRE family transcriptional regulator
MLPIEEIKAIFDETKKVSNNFRNLTYEILTEQVNNSSVIPSQRIIIFRLALGLKRNEFCKILQIKPQTLIFLETGHQQLKTKLTSSRYMKIISSLIKRRTSWKNVKRNYRNFLKEMKERAKATGTIGGNKIKKKYGLDYYKKLAKKGAKKGGLSVYRKYGSKIYREMGLKGGSEGGKKGGITMAKISPLTEQEKLFLQHALNSDYLCYWIRKNEIRVYQKNMQFKKISESKLKKILETVDKICEIRSMLKADRNYVADFALSLSKELKAIVECTRVVTHNVSTYLKAVELCTRKKMLENFYPNSMFIVVVSDKMPTEALLRLLSCYNVIFEDYLDIFLDRFEATPKNVNLNSKIYEDLMMRENDKRLIPVTASQKIIRTELEKKILKMLEGRFNFQVGFAIKSIVGSTHFTDFTLFDDVTQPKVIIEATHVNDNSYKRIVKGMLRVWSKIDFYKRYCTDYPYYVGVLASPEEIIYPEVNKIGSICDLFITNNNFSNLPELLKNIQKSKTEISDKEIIDIWKRVKD